MNKLVVATATGFLSVGILIGNLAGELGFRFFAGDETEVVKGSEAEVAGGDETETAATKNAKVDRVQVHSGTDRNRIRREGIPSTTPAETASSTDPRWAEWEQRYPGTPPPDPPHVADPYFFSFDRDDPEAIRARKEAHKLHIESLREAGVSETDIEAVEEEFAHDFDSEPTEGLVDEVPPILEDQAESLAVSLKDAGESAEHVQDMVDDFWAQEEEVAEQNAIDEMGPMDPDGLDHAESLSKN